MIFSRVMARFDLAGRGSTPGREVLGGITTYMALVYIVFVQPALLHKAGMDFGAAMMATCLASGLACLVMGLVANYPVALAPAMGTNFYFVYAVALGLKVGWQAALAATFVAALLFLGLTVVGLRRKIIDALPPSLTHGVAAGIGLMIAVIGLQWSGVIVAHPGTLVGLGHLGRPPTLVALFGLAVMAVLWVRRVPGAILIGIGAAAGLALATGQLEYHGLISWPPSPGPTAFKLDFSALLSGEMLVVIAVLLFLDVFDTVGTLVGIAPEAGLMKDGHLVAGRKALLADATGTAVGALLGTSTITSYVESAAGIHAGARTGLAAVVTGVILLLTPFFYPLIKTIGAGVVVSPELTLYPVTAPALIIVGVMMMRAATRIEWSKPGEAVPAFLAMIMMPLTVSITEGIAFGLIAYSVLAVVNGRARRVSWWLHLCAGLLLLRYLFLV